MNAEIFAALAQLEKERGIPQDYMLEKITQALIAAYKKDKEGYTDNVFVEIKDNEKKEVERKVFPGYVLVKMVMRDDTWYIVRNIRGVTGFVGPGSKPVPLTEREIESLGIDKKVVEISFNVGDSLKITDGPLEGFIGTVEEIEADKSRVKLIVHMFGKETPVELELTQVEVL